jgi:hypothetical protein
MTMLQRQAKPDPYCSFRSDRERRIALISRDLRYVLVALALAVSQGEIPWRELLRWVGFAA